jgi:formamidopyrimidine-DNA glycosylase
LPELPEVETVRRAIAPALEGRRLDGVEIDDPRLTRPFDPAEVAAELRGEQVRKVDRRGKYLVVRFESGRALLVHLRMTGSLRDSALEGDPHRRALLTLDDGRRVAYKDVRRFGTWLLLEPHEVEPYLAARLGEEPLLSAFTARGLGERLRGRRAPLKAALLDQRTIAGLGNIYVDEALWYARLNPLREAGTLEPPELRRLHRAIRKALELGLARQGSTLSDYRLPDGSEGAMQNEFRAYGRTDRNGVGDPCDRCGTTFARARVGGRSTWYCPACQP